MNRADPPRWRHFRFREAAEALAWAAAGNVAVHDTGRSLSYRGQRYEHTAHLFAADERALLKAARRVGCPVRWIQRRRTRSSGRLAGAFTTHFDLFGERLDSALRLCSADEGSQTGHTSAGAPGARHSPGQ